MPNAGIDRFCAAMTELHTISKVNTAGVTACFENYARYRDQESAEMLAQSLALGLKQIAYCRQEILLLTLDQEVAAIKQQF